MATKKLYGHLNITTGCSLISTNTTHTIGALTITGGSLGLNTTSPLGNMHIVCTNTFGNVFLDNVVQNRKVVMYNDINNEHQFYGLGINDNTFRFQIPSSGTTFRYYRGDSASASTQISYLHGNGELWCAGQGAFNGNGTFNSGTDAVLSIENQGSFCRLAAHNLTIWEHGYSGDRFQIEGGQIYTYGRTTLGPGGHFVIDGNVAGSSKGISIYNMNGWWSHFGHYDGNNHWRGNANYFQGYTEINNQLTVNAGDISWDNGTIEVYGGAGGAGQHWMTALFNSGGGGAIWGGGSYVGASQISIYSQRCTMCSSLVIPSDSRIKKNIADINDNSALEALRQLQPKTYNYIDTIDKGSDTVYGFIAQEVKQVLPYAVTTKKEFIPNVLKGALYANNTLTLLNDDTFDLDLTKGNKLKLYYESEPEKTVTIESISEDLHSVTIAEDLEHTQYVVYGQEVDDFNALNKSAIWTVATAALQEVDSGLQQTKSRVDQVQEKTAQLKAFLRSKFPGEI